MELEELMELEEIMELERIMELELEELQPILEGSSNQSNLKLFSLFRFDFIAKLLTTDS